MKDDKFFGTIGQDDREETRTDMNPAVTVITSELRILHMPASEYMRTKGTLCEHIVLPGTVKPVKVQAASYELVEVAK